MTAYDSKADPSKQSNRMYSFPAGTLKILVAALSKASGSPSNRRARVSPVQEVTSMSPVTEEPTGMDEINLDASTETLPCTLRPAAKGRQIRVPSFRISTVPHLTHGCTWPVSWCTTPAFIPTVEVLASGRSARLERLLEALCSALSPRRKPPPAGSLAGCCDRAKCRTDLNHMRIATG